MKKSYILIAAAALLVITCIAGVLVANPDLVHAIVNRDRILDTDYVGTVSDYTWSEDLQYRLEDHAVIQKDPDKDFVVMNVTDLHLSDYTQDAVTNIRNFDNIRRMAEKLQPDLITLSGDLVWKDSTVYSVQRLTEFMDSLGIPWAPIFGNHDAEGNCDANYLAEVMMEGEFCLMQKGDPSMGVGNYIVNVCEGEKIVHSIILFDSHNGNLWENQVQWYQWAVSGVNSLSDEKVTSSVIMHVPFAQYAYAYDEAWDGEDWKDGYDAFGFKREDFAGATDENGQPMDNGFFATIKELGSTTNAICGHDHANCYSILYEGVRLTYSLRLGYGAYFEFDQQGVTTLTIGSDGSGTVEHHYLYPYDVENPLNFEPSSIERISWE